MATNAARHRLAAGWDKKLMEFGARRAQGPDGAMSASRYAYLGGFDGTSNTRAGFVFGIPVAGTQAHSLVTAFTGFHDIQNKTLGKCNDIVSLVQEKHALVTELLGRHEIPVLGHAGELSAFIAYAQAFPNSFVCLVDTYDTLSTGVPNFLSVALAMVELGYTPKGIRLDSGDLAYLSIESRRRFRIVAKELNVPVDTMTIIASNNINENILKALNDQKHDIDGFGIGTHLVTCQAQPSLGMVYKLAEINHQPCMKLSQDVYKASIPGRKLVYRLYNRAGEPKVDLIQSADAPAPTVGDRIYCRHLFVGTKRCYMVPSKVENFLRHVWHKGRIAERPNTLEEARQVCMQSLKTFRPDHLRPVNPTPFKVASSREFYEFFHNFWQNVAPVVTIE
eukprot:GHVT01071617.1.p1 GENE.GHVT01071617.1~~GHVT01071617.1.p1  ORF type:complete len:393 (+),score=18.54 GHVT01071617.1:2083-3261(+)